MIDFILRPVRKISLKNKRRHCRWGAAEVRPLIGRELYRAKPSTTLDLGFYALNQDKSPLTTSQRHWGTILTGIPTGYLSFIQYKYTHFFYLHDKIDVYLTFNMTNTAGVGVVSCEEGVLTKLTESVPPLGPLGGGPFAEGLQRGHVSFVHGTRASKQVAIGWTEHLGLAHTEK